MRDEGGRREDGWESMAQLTSVRLRVRADNSIDRRCSTDTAYPFQPHRGQADLYTEVDTPGGGSTGGGDDDGSGGGGGRGRKETRRGCGTGGGAAAHHRAALTLRSLTFPDVPR